MAEIKVDEKNFDSEVINSNLPVMVDFWAEWCGPCKALGPIVEEIAGENEGKLKVGKLNVDENNQLAMKYGVMSIPTLKFFKGGKVMDQMVGVQDKATIQAKLEELEISKETLLDITIKDIVEVGSPIPFL